MLLMSSNRKNTSVMEWRCGVEKGIQDSKSCIKTLGSDILFLGCGDDFMVYTKVKFMQLYFLNTEFLAPIVS